MSEEERSSSFLCPALFGASADHVGNANEHAVAVAVVFLWHVWIHHGYDEVRDEYDCNELDGILSRSIHESSGVEEEDPAQNTANEPPKLCASVTTSLSNDP